MFEKFEALNDEKKKTIINASMKEFVKGGYEKASMNAVVETAGISKGSLFYYFENKKKLYLYLFEYCEKLILNNAHRHLENNESDFIKRMEHVIKCNVSLLSDYPLVYGFVRSCKMEKSLNVVAEVQEIKAKTSEALFGEIYKDIDESLFRDEIDIKMAIYSIKATMFQLVHDAMRKNENNSEQLLKQIADCRRFFEVALYKN